MPATVIYRPGFVRNERAVETSATVAADGLVTASALFLANDGFEINSPISKSYFAALNNIAIQGLYVESRSLEKRGGLWFLRVNAVGVTNPSVILLATDASPRSFNKTETIGEASLSFSFDYISETITASTVFTKNNKFSIKNQSPKLLQIYNRRGIGTINLLGVIGQEAGTALSRAGVQAYPRILTSETRNERAGIIQLQKTFQFVYE